MDSVELVSIARSLIDIESTTGHEAEATAWLARDLCGRGYNVVEQPVGDGRSNLLATLDAPHIVFSTHIDCVPPFFPSREENELLFGRGACDAKGILASQIAAAERLRGEGERRVGLLFVVGEERGSDGARIANANPAGSRYLIDGEPTDNQLAVATRGVLRLKLKATGRAAHSSHPDLGESAIERLVDALTMLRTLALPEDPVFGRTFYTAGLISGGVAPNVVPPEAEAEVNFRTVGDAAPIYDALRPLNDLVAVEHVVNVPPVRLHTLPGFPGAVFPFTTDVPLLSAWGRPVLVGPGSAKVAHTDHEHVAIPELMRAVGLYVIIAKQLLAE